MASINLDQSYKTVCKYCGLVKKSLVPGNFVCGKCKKFCEQQLSGEELAKRDLEIANLIGHECLSVHDTESQFILKAYKAAQSPVLSISNEQYLSVCRILKKKGKLNENKNSRNFNRRSTAN